MSAQMVRSGAAAAVELVLEIVVGAGMLLLFLVAMAWDPIDRKLGLHARRVAERQEQRTVVAPPVAELRATDGAYGIAAA